MVRCGVQAYKGGFAIGKNKFTESNLERNQKRLQFYVKKENKWEKDAEHEEIDKSIAKVSKKQILILTDWCKANPGYEDDPEKSEEYFKLVGRTMGPNDEKRLRQIKKILAENVKITQPKKEENIIIKE